MFKKKKKLIRAIKNYKYIKKNYGNHFLITLKYKLIEQKKDKSILNLFNFFFPDLKRDNVTALKHIILKIAL